jgi:nicotinamide-nucleotide amidase
MHKSTNRLVLGGIFALLLGMLGMLGTEIVRAHHTLEPDLDSPVEYALIITGGELLAGVYADSHTHFITRTLAPLGLCCVASITVADTSAELEEALEFAGKQVGLILVTGGLGPTGDDVTREALSKYTGIPVKQDPEVLRRIEARFGRSIRGQENLERQTRVPVKGGYLNNPEGTAVGLVFDRGSQVVVAFPGPPRELRPMVENELVPFLATRFGTRSVGTSLTMRFVGIGESSIDQIMRDHLDLPEGLVVSSLFEGGRVDVTFSLPGTAEEDRKRLEKLEGQLLKHTSEHMYSDDGSTLEESIIGLLRVRKLSLAIAESGSGGAVSAALSGAPGNPDYLKGGFIASENSMLARMMGIPGESFAAAADSPKQMVELIARHAAERTESSWVLAISQPTREEDGVVVWVAAGSRASGFEVTRMRERPGRSDRSRQVTRILDFLRGCLLNSPALVGD